MALKNPTWAFLLVIPVVILLGAAIALGQDVVLGVTPSGQVPATGLIVAILLVCAIALGVVYTRLDAKLRAESGGTVVLSLRTKTK